MSALSVIMLLHLFALLQASHQDDGGWDTNVEDRIAQPGPCNIVIQDGSLTQEQFLERYAYNEPVVIKGASRNQIFQSQTRRSSLLERYGHTTVRLSSANSYSYAKRDISFKDYCDHHLHPQKLTTLGNETFYFFGDNNGDEWQDILDMYEYPPYYLPHHLPALSFGLAGPGTGVPFHFHGPGFAETIWGRKRWFMYPPDMNPNFHPNRTTLQWLIEDYPRMKDDPNLYECTLLPGEILALAHQIGSEGYNNMHGKDVEELVEGLTAELMDEEPVELTQSAEEEKGEDFAHPQLTLDNLAEGFMMVKAVTD